MTNEKCDHPKFHENQLFESFIHKHILDPLHSDYARFLYYDNWPGAEDRDFISLDPINAGRITDLVSVFITEHGENAG